jgi:hypothetical protein
MYVIEGKNGKTKYWASVLEECYEPNAHIALALDLNTSRSAKTYKVKIKIAEAVAFVRMFRHVADAIESAMTLYEGRYPPGTKLAQPKPKSRSD